MNRIIYNIIFFVISFIVFSCGVQAQQKQRLKLAGKVTDRQTGQPLKGATVSLVDARLVTITDSSGNYSFNNVPYGHTIVEISHVGYSTKADHLDILKNTEMEFALLPSVIEHEAITVTAVGGPVAQRKAPVSITRINRSQLLAGSSTNLIDALTRQPGISQIATGPAISKPVIRGLGYNRLVVINDGMRQEGQQWGDEHGIEIDENSVQRVEIVKGPASLIYGSDALAGVINVISNRPVPLNTISGSVMSGYMTNNRQSTLFANISGNRGHFNWNAWADRKTAADYRNKYDGYVYNSKFNENNFGGNAGVNGYWGYSTLTVSQFNQKAGVVEGERDENGNFIKPLAGGGESNPDRGDFRSVVPQLPYQHTRHLKIVSDNSFRAGTGKLNFIAAFQNNRRIEYGDPDAPDEPELYFDLKTVNYRLAYQFSDHHGWSNTVGLNGMFQTNRNKGEELLIPEYSMFDLGGYFYSQKTFGKTTFSGGLRFDYRSLDSRGELVDGDTVFTAFNRKFSNVSGSLGLSHAVSDKITLKANLARGFRAPSIPELASRGVHEGTNRFEYGDKNLKSETSLQGELSLEVASEHLLLTSSVFINSIDNFIFYSRLKNDAGGDSTVNVEGEEVDAFRFEQSRATLAGAEFKMDLHPHPLDWLHLETAFSYVHGSFKDAVDGSRNLPLIPGARLVSGLRAELLPQGKVIRNLSLFMEWDKTFTQNRAFTGYGTETFTPGYDLINGGFHFDVRRKSGNLLTLFFIASNITDEAYQSHLSRLKYTAINEVSGRRGVFNMGRNFTVKINVPLNFKTS